MSKSSQSKYKESPALFSKIKIKEDSTSDEIIEEQTYNFIGANTLPDRTAEILPDGTRIEGEILSKEVLETFAGLINDKSKSGGKYGSYRTISLFHNRVHNQDYTLEEAGYVKAGTAKVLELEEYPGNYGLFLDVEVNEKFNPPAEHQDYTAEKIHYKIKKDVLGLSLEYNNTADQEKIVEVNGDKYRYILNSNDFRGFGFARVNLIGNPSAVRVKELTLSQENVDDLKKNKGEKTMSEEEKAAAAKLEAEKIEAEKLVKLEEENKGLKAEIEKSKKLGEEKKVEELNGKVEEVESKIKEIKLKADATATKLKESIELAFSGLNFNAPANTSVPDSKVKVKEIYADIEAKNWIKFKEMSMKHIEENSTKLKELLARDGMGFDFEKHQTLKVKCVGSQMVVVPSAKTKDVIDSSDMAESVYYQTNAMFADRYVQGITETFLMEDSLLTAMPKEQYIGGNDKYQWKLWVDFETVTGDNTLAVDPNVTSVIRSKRKFEKMETRIVEYRDGVEVTDFTQHHSMAAVGDLLGIELERAAQAVTESMNADLFKPKTDATTGWLGFVGLIGIADSSTYGTLYGKVRSAANRLLDATTANTYVTTSEAVSVSVVRAGYEKVLAHGTNIANAIIAMHPTQVRKLFDVEDAAIRNNILTMSGAPAAFGFNRTVMPHIDGIPIIRDYRCESSAAAADMFVVMDFSPSKGFNLIVSKPLGARGLAKVGTSEAAYVNFWGCTVYKSPRNVFLHDSLT